MSPAPSSCCRSRHEAFALTVFVLSKAHAVVMMMMDNGLQMIYDNTSS